MIAEEERRPSLIGHDPSRVKNEIELSEEEKKVPGILEVKSALVAQAINHGYILVGEEDFNLIDYIVATFQGLSTDEFKRTRFLLVNIWGEQGAMKTNLAVQLIAWAAGCYEEGISREEWRKRWAWVREMCIVSRQDLIRVGRRIQAGDTARFPVILLDDVNSILGRQLAWEDRDLYRLSFTVWGMIRRVVGTVITTEPNIEMIMEVLKEIMNFEVIVYPGSKGNPSIPSYKAERMCHDIHPFFRATDKTSKIIVEEDVPFDPLSVPTWWWETYQPATSTEGRESFGKMLDRMEELEDELISGKDDKAEKLRLAKSATAHAFTNGDVKKLALKNDIHASAENIQALVRDLKSLIETKAAENPPSEAP
jgi:hypothetical protein